MWLNPYAPYFSFPNQTALAEVLRTGCLFQTIFLEFFSKTGYICLRRKSGKKEITWNLWNLLRTHLGSEPSVIQGQGREINLSHLKRLCNSHKNPSRLGQLTHQGLAARASFSCSELQLVPQEQLSLSAAFDNGALPPGLAGASGSQALGRGDRR